MQQRCSFELLGIFWAVDKAKLHWGPECMAQIPIKHPHAKWKMVMMQYYAMHADSVYYMQIISNTCHWSIFRFAGVNGYKVKIIKRKQNFGWVPSETPVSKAKNAPEQPPIYLLREALPGLLVQNTFWRFTDNPFWQSVLFIQQQGLNWQAPLVQMRPQLLCGKVAEMGGQ